MWERERRSTGDSLHRPNGWKFLPHSTFLEENMINKIFKITSLLYFISGCVLIIVSIIKSNALLFLLASFMIVTGYMDLRNAYGKRKLS